MGSLTIPASGTVYLDADSLIYSVETHAPYWSLLYPLWLASQAGLITLVTSELSIVETLMIPLRNQNTVLVTAYTQLFRSSEIKMVSITDTILYEAATLRSSIVGLRTPDSIHATTALQQKCSLFVTNDRGYRRISHLPFVLLDDVLAVP